MMESRAQHSSGLTAFFVKKGLRAVMNAPRLKERTDA
mgnify:CR=1 FL=1